MKYKKLVRDKIPEHIRKKGGNPTYYIADKKEYWEKLKEKILEEVNEFLVDESKEEFADLLEVIEVIAEYKKFDQDEIKKIRNKKTKERGSFKNRIILDGL